MSHPQKLTTNDCVKVAADPSQLLVSVGVTHRPTRRNPRSFPCAAAGLETPAVATVAVRVARTT